MKKDSLNDLVKRIDAFCIERNWNHEHPNSLIASTVIELGELAEHYQWQSKFSKFSEEEKKEIAFEFVDVLFYLYRLASITGIDLEEAFNDKLPRLAKKFPIGSDTKVQNKEYRKTGKNRLYD